MIISKEKRMVIARAIHKHRYSVAIAIIALTVGIWVQYIYSNGHCVIFDTINMLFILISNYPGPTIALFALAVSFITIWQNHRHNRLSVIPNLELLVNHDNKIYSRYVINTGLGPAVIESVDIFIDGKIINDRGRTKYAEKLAHFCKYNSVGEFRRKNKHLVLDHVFHLSKGNNILSNQTEYLLRFDISGFYGEEDKDKKEYGRIIAELDARIKIKVKCRSMYFEYFDVG